jgi:riboflavin kinase/FMN adenylyltransferase
MTEPTMGAGPRQEHALDSLPRSLRGCVLTIGNFDGVHRGHQRILQAARSQGDSSGAPVVAMTFEPPPDRSLRPSDEPRRLLPPEVKRSLLLEAGADGVVTARVDAVFLSLTAEEFVEQVLVGRLAARQVVEGEDFFFGRGRAGNVEFLRQAGRRHGFEVRVVEAVRVELGGKRWRISSNLIRRRLILGDVESAEACLGRPFTLYGRIVHGQGQGRRMDFPTVNLATSDQIVPAHGVYAGRAGIEGRSYPAAVSIGCKPTFTAARPDPTGPAPASRTVEAFLLDAEGDFYGRDMTLQFLHQLRPQERFEGPEALRAQIAKDVERVRKLLP